MTPQQRALLPKLAIAGVDRHNGVLRDVCRERGLDCLDRATLLPKDTTVFYDDCHFNEAGARRVASLFAEHVRTRSGSFRRTR